MGYDFQSFISFLKKSGLLFMCFEFFYLKIWVHKIPKRSEKIKQISYNLKKKT